MSKDYRVNPEVIPGNPLNAREDDASRYIVLTIDSTDNAAFEDTGREQEVARIVKEMAQKLENGDVGLGQLHDRHPLRDLNGNTVGSWVVTNEKPIPGSPADGFRAFAELDTDPASSPDSVLVQALLETAHRIAGGQAQFALHDWKGNRVGEALLTQPPSLSNESLKTSGANFRSDDDMAP